MCTLFFVHTTRFSNLCARDSAAQERLIMLKEMERLKEEELAAAIEKKLAGKALMAEVAASNAEQIRRKELQKVGGG